MKDDKDIDEKPKGTSKSSKAEAKESAEKEAAEAEEDMSEQGKNAAPRKEEDVKKD